jgi:glycosyltransferase involved in cell wall biosynthesis
MTADNGKKLEDLRIAWLMPSAEAGAHWQPIWSNFLKIFQNTIFYTTRVWAEFDREAPYASAVYQVGNFNSFLVDRKGIGYQHGFLNLPFNIVLYLAKFKPHVIIANAFSIWSLLAIFLKPLFDWKIIILYEGSTPSSDFRDSKIRSITRQFIANHSDTFVANTKSAKDYLSQFLKIDEKKIVLGPYLLPDRNAMTQKRQAIDFDFSSLKRPTFLFVGQIINRKGVYELLEACSILKEKGCYDYTVLMIGEGSERDRLEELTHTKQLADQVILLGRKSYSELGSYFQKSDVFVFPTFEDTWGMVPLEAMIFEKPILCSKYAGASELMIEGGNGYLIDPKSPEEIADRMHRLITHQSLIDEMGKKSKEIIEEHTIDSAMQVFSKAISMTM